MTPNSLRLALVTVVVMLQLTSLTVVSVMSDKQLQQQERMEVSAALTMHADEVVEKTRLFLVPALSQLTVARQLIADGVLDARSNPILSTFFRSQLRSNHWLNGMSLAREDGSLIQVGKFADELKAGQTIDQEQMVTKSIIVQGEHRQVIFEQQNALTGETRQWNNAEQPSDPRQLDWYQLARRENRLVWSDAFTVHVAGHPVISASVPLRTREGLDAGVLSVAIDLNDLTAFIRNTRAGSSLSAVMLDANGRVIAHSAGENQAGSGDLSDIESRMHAPGNSALFELYSRTREAGWQNNGSDTLVEHMNLADEKQLGLTRAVRLFNGAINWSLLIAQPELPTFHSSGKILNSGMRLAMIIIATPGILALLFVVAITAPIYRLHRRATVDQLTRAYNRDEFERQLNNLLANSNATPASKRRVVVALDLDGFKIINDSHGHGAGDAVLKTVVKRLRSNLQPKDIVGRTGGDEFAFTCLVDRHLDPVRHLEQLRLKVVSEPLSIATGVLAFGMTLGIAEIEPGDSTDAVMKRADKALIAGKATGKNFTYIFADNPPTTPEGHSVIGAHKDLAIV